VLTYALARELLLSDRPSLDHIANETIRAGYGFQDLLLEIVSSDAFLQKLTSQIAAKSGSKP